MFGAVGAIQLGKGAHVVFLYFPQPWRTRYRYWLNPVTVEMLRSTTEYMKYGYMGYTHARAEF